MKRSPRIGLRDWWLLLPPLSIGVLTWAAFFYVGLRARNRTWLTWAAIYLGALMGAFALDAAVGSKDWSSTLAGFVLFALAGGGFAHAVAIRSTFYGEDEDEYGVAQRRLAAREMGRKMVADDPERARQMGVGRPDLKESFDADLVDLNSAPASAIASVCGVSSATAERIVEARGGTEGFSSVDDMDLLLNLPPAEVARLHDAGVCVPVD